MRTSVEPNKIHIVGNVLMRAIQNVFFIEFESLCQSYEHLCQIYQTHSPNMFMSRDSGLKFGRFFSPNSVLNFGKVTNLGTCYKQKTNWGWKTPPPLSAYRVKKG